MNEYYKKIQQVYDSFHKDCMNEALQIFNKVSEEHPVNAIRG